MGRLLNEEEIRDDVRGVLLTTLADLEREDEDSRLMFTKAQEAAQSLIELAGFDLEDSDHFGDVTAGVVSNCLIIAMLRCPELVPELAEAIGS